MTVIDQLKREIETLSDDCLSEVMDFVGYLKSKKVREIPETMLLSEIALSEDWNTPEEDETWANL